MINLISQVLLFMRLVGRAYETPYCRMMKIDIIISNSRKKEPKVVEREQWRHVKNEKIRYNIKYVDYKLR